MVLPDEELDATRLASFLTMTFRAGFIYALEDLVNSNLAGSSRPDEILAILAKDLRAGKKIIGTRRDVQDRWATFCQECRLPRQYCEYLKSKFFSSWKDFRTGEIQAL